MTIEAATDQSGQTQENRFKQDGMTLAVGACLMIFRIVALSEDRFPSEDPDDYDVVLTPTRLKQSLHDVPAGVTVLTGDMLKRNGITSVSEAMRSALDANECTAQHHTSIACVSLFYHERSQSACRLVFLLATDQQKPTSKNRCEQA